MSWRSSGVSTFAAQVGSAGMFAATYAPPPPGFTPRTPDEIVGDRVVAPGQRRTWRRTSGAGDDWVRRCGAGQAQEAQAKEAWQAPTQTPSSRSLALARRQVNDDDPPRSTSAHRGVTRPAEDLPLQLRQRR
jgi:hypothetical protein